MVPAGLSALVSVDTAHICGALAFECAGRHLAATSGPGGASRWPGPRTLALTAFTLSTEEKLALPHACDSGGAAEDLVRCAGATLTRHGLLLAWWQRVLLAPPRPVGGRVPLSGAPGTSTVANPESTAHPQCSREFLAKCALRATRSRDTDHCRVVTKGAGGAAQTQRRARTAHRPAGTSTLGDQHHLAAARVAAQSVLCGRPSHATRTTGSVVAKGADGTA